MVGVEGPVRRTESVFKLTDTRPFRLVEGGGEDDPAGRSRRAWEHVADGFRAGLSELCAGDEHYELMSRCLRWASALGGVPAICLVQSALQDLTGG